MRMKKHPQFFTSKSSCRSSRVGITIGIDLGDIWSHYCTLNEDGEVIDRDVSARMLRGRARQAEPVSLQGRGLDKCVEGDE
jgi:hypothetical protein